MNYRKLKSTDLVHECGDSAEKWAAAFCQLNPEAVVDEHTLFAWFANAIEHSHDLRTGHIINGEHAEYLLSRARGQEMTGDEGLHT